MEFCAAKKTIVAALAGFCLIAEVKESSAVEFVSTSRVSDNESGLNELISAHINKTKSRNVHNSVDSVELAESQSRYMKYSYTAPSSPANLPASAMTGGAADIDLSGNPDNKPILAYLKESNTLISPVDDQDAAPGVWGESSPILSSGSAYILAPLSLDGENTITKYELNSVQNELMLKYTQADLQKTSYGSGSSVKYFEWITDENGNKKLVEVSSPTSGETSIIYHYDEADTHLRINNSSNYGNVTGNFISSHVSSNGGAIYNNGTIGDIASDFISNSVSQGNGGAIYNSSNITGNITGDFIGNSVSVIGGNTTVYAFGGAIFNKSNITNIVGDFIGNSVSAIGGNTSVNAYGGVIANKGGHIGDIEGVFSGNFSYAYNTATSASAMAEGGVIENNTAGVIDNIRGEFTGNYCIGTLADGGVIHNIEGSKIGSITGNFINNYTKSFEDITPEDRPGVKLHAQGGAIYNYMSTIGDITGNFINNYAKSTRHTYGGAIISLGENTSVGNITGDFTGNYSAGGVLGAAGAIYNASIMGLIKGAFTGNYAEGLGTTAQGGAIFNSGSIAGLQGDGFSDNYVTANTNAFGGAIYNTGTFTNGIKNVSFKNNYAKSSSGFAKGGAIYTTNNLSIIADNGISEFTGNYIQVGNGEKEAEALYIDSTANVTFIAQNNGTIKFDDNINATSSSNKLFLQGDTTGSIYLNGLLKNVTAQLDSGNLYFNTDTFKNSQLTVQGGSINLSDNLYKTYNFKNLSSNSSAHWNLDIDLASKKSDVFSVAGGSGTIYIDNINTSNLPSEDCSIILQIIKSSSSSGPQLSLNSSLMAKELLKETIVFEADTINAVTNWDTIYQKLEQIVRQYRQLGLATTNTANDSIEYKVFNEILDNGYSIQGDTLKLWNQLDTTDAKTFKFADASNTYTLTDNLGATKGNSTVSGVANGNNKSTLNMNGKTGFEVASGKTLTLNNVNITNAVNSEGSVVNNASGGVANINNINLNSTNSNAAIKNAGTLNVTGGTNTIGTAISGTGTMNINGGSTLTMNNNKSITQGTVNVNNGTLNLSDTAKVNGTLTLGASGTANMSANGITSNVTNAGNLNLSGGILNHIIRGSGTTNIKGTVTSNSAVLQAISIISGADLTINASNIGGAVSNTGELKLIGGTLNKAVSGAGSTTITGDLTNAGGINQAVTVNSGVILTNNAALGSDTGMITNAGTINSSASNIEGDVSNAGTVTRREVWQKGWGSLAKERYIIYIDKYVSRITFLVSF